MRSLIDTTIIIDYLRNNQGAVGFIEQLVTTKQIVSASVISYAEVYAGARSKEEEAISKFFASIEIISVGIKIAEYAGRYLNIYCRSHNLELADALIAATAFSRLVTLNRKHFPMDDIQVYIPY